AMVSTTIPSLGRSHDRPAPGSSRHGRPVTGRSRQPHAWRHKAKAAGAASNSLLGRRQMRAFREDACLHKFMQADALIALPIPRCAASFWTRVAVGRRGRVGRMASPVMVADLEVLCGPYRRWRAPRTSHLHAGKEHVMRSLSAAELLKLRSTRSAWIPLAAA